MNFMTQRTKQDSPAALRALCLCAERELSAFARAVEELFGPEQARQSIEDWMEELESMDWRTQKGVRDWRRLTIAAAARLASRVNVLPQRQDPITK
jgi:hypothetical protein